MFLRRSVMKKTDASVEALVEDRLFDLKPADLNDVEKQSVITLAMKVLSIKHRAGRVLSKPDETRDFLRLRLADYRNEVFGCLFVDNRHRIIAVRELFQGTIDGASVYPRVVVQQAMEVNAAAVVFFHNHPSGVAEPSHADEAITRRLKDALALVDVRVLDHFVVSAGESVSFAERGLL
ncbi:MAG: DNA repair protein RadC [gamma proteobacterium symbiont of Ctena orbiculata]|nr:MAG: DNA repair protein RadC [gamma proteobacterium symbiont of Ctena orbiculata]